MTPSPSPPPSLQQPKEQFLLFWNLVNGKFDKRLLCYFETWLLVFWNAIIGIQTDLSLILSPNWLSSSQSHSHHNVSNIQEMTWKYKCRNYPNLHEVSTSWIHEIFLTRRLIPENASTLVPLQKSSKIEITLQANWAESQQTNNELTSCIQGIS